jgi:hypothetical protein
MSASQIRFGAAAVKLRSSRFAKRFGRVDTLVKCRHLRRKAIH